ncbi:RDD family protein [Chitinibacter tainanensis]|uniref:RDD family protein n=1 Tax=Chitinibacter tainanensis TaxID=230667 RepID=UPI002352B563|nr:RDD family protein [Chitinibacter tainanensis]
MKPDEHFEAHLGAAAWGRRLVAFIYELLLLAAVLLIAEGVFQGLMQLLLGITPEHLSDALWARILNGVWVLAVCYAYFGWCWTRGQTLAMMTWRMRVAPLTGELSWRQASIRFAVATAFYAPLLPLWVLAIYYPQYHWLAWLGSIWFCVPWITARCDADGQLLHDRLAKTRIVNSPSKK